MNDLRIPIFIISFNRLTVLKKSIASFRQIRNHRLVIHDAGSTYAPLLEYLGQLEREGETIYRNRPAITLGDDLNSVADTVQRWLDAHPRVQHYVVTDPDVALEPGCEDIFELYTSMLDSFGLDVIGPMLRIDDIPDHYPLKEKVIKGHTEQFWRKRRFDRSWKGGRFGFQHAPIDTTFAMYPPRLPFRRLRGGWRTYAPYWARHLDWYIDPANMSHDQRFYLETASQVSHWGGVWLRNKIERGEDPDYYS